MSTAWIAGRQADITGERITALMFRHRYTVSSLAAAIGKGRASISTKVHGHARWYNDELVAIAAVLNTTVGYLLGETDDDRRPEHMRQKDTAENQKTTAASATGVVVAEAGLDPATSRL